MFPWFRMPLRVRCQAGLTLVELMIVVAIIGILVAVAAPQYFQDLPRRKLREAARDMLAQMQTARMKAVSENRQWRVIFVDNAGGNNDSYQLWHGGNDKDLATVADNVMVYDVSLAAYSGRVQYGFGNATQSWNGGAMNQAASVTFTNRGMITGAATSSVYLTTNTSGGGDIYCYALNVSPGGAIKLRFYNGRTPFAQNNWME